MERTDCNGEDLLELFDTLNIQLGSLNPNVIKGWFDTDCQETKDFLNWMCRSLSKENVLGAQQEKEASELDRLLEGEELEAAVTEVEGKYPGIFDEISDFDIEILEDEKEMYTKELEHLEHLIGIHENLAGNLAIEIKTLRDEEIAVKLEEEKATKKCTELAERLDDLNVQLFTQIKRYGGYLYDFEFATVPSFINNMNIDDCEENLQMISAYLNTVLRKEFQQLSGDVTANKSTLTENSSSNLICDKIDTLRNRIFHSWKNYLAEKFEEEELRSVLNFLNSYDIDSLSNVTDCLQLEMNIDAKMAQKTVMLNMVENICAKHADYQVSQPKLRHAQNDLEVHQAKLDHISKLETEVTKLLASYGIMRILFEQESSDIAGSDVFFKKVINYITKDIHSCNLRTEAMTRIIDEFKIYDSLPLLQKSKLISEIVRHYSDKKGDISLMEAVDLKNQFMSNVAAVENRLFNQETENYKVKTLKIKESIKVLNNFLVCGPTCRIVVVPSRLLVTFKKLDHLMESQSICVKTVVQISSDTLAKLSKNKWLKNRRLLWMHFINDPPKLFALLREAEEEFDKIKAIK